MATAQKWFRNNRWMSKDEILKYNNKKNTQEEVEDIEEEIKIEEPKVIEEKEIKYESKEVKELKEEIKKEADKVSEEKKSNKKVNK